MVFVRVVGDVRAELADRSRPAIERKDVELASGSGFVIAPSGLLLTSWHVVSDEAEPTTFGGREADVSVQGRRIEVAIGSGGDAGAFEAHVVASDSLSDLAVLQVTAADLPYLPLGDSDAAEPGRPVTVLGFPFGHQVEVGKREAAAVVPAVTVTAGSLSAARTDEEGATRFLQTDASVNPGNSGGPMLDEEGYVVGVVGMKLARDAVSQGAGFAVPVDVVKDFLDASGLAPQLPVTRLRPGVRHTLDWKRLAVDLPDGYSDASSSRVLADGGEMGEIGFRAYRLATEWPLPALEEALLGGREVPGFVPAPAAAGQRRTPARRPAVALASGSPPSVIGSAAGTDASDRRFRVEYAIVDRGKEKVVARYLGPADAVAFNLGLIRRSLLSLEAGPMIPDRTPGPPAAGSPAMEVVSFPEGDGRVPAPAGWAREPAWQSACGRVPAPENGLAASHPGDFTLVLRALRWSAADAGLDEAVRGCGPGAGRAAGKGGGGPATYAARFTRLGVLMEARGLLVRRGAEALLLELEAPVSKREAVAGLYDRWVREVAAAR
jgi:hypothetical protein